MPSLGLYPLGLPLTALTASVDAILFNGLSSSLSSSISRILLVVDLGVGAGIPVEPLGPLIPAGHRASFEGGNRRTVSSFFFAFGALGCR